MVAEKIDAGCCGVERDGDGPSAGGFIKLHVGPLIVGDHLVEVASATIRRSVVDPPDASARRFCAGRETSGHLQMAVAQLMGDGGWWQQGLDFIWEEVTQEKRGLVPFIRFDTGMAGPFAVPGVGAQIEWNGRVVRTTPGQVKRYEIVGAGVEQQVDLAGTQGVQITRNEHRLGEATGELLQFLSGASRCQRLTVKQGAVMSAQERVTQWSRRFQLVPRLTITKPQGRIPDR